MMRANWLWVVVAWLLALAPLGARAECHYTSGGPTTVT